MTARLLRHWLLAVLGVLAGLAGVVSLVDPANTAMWVWIVVAVGLLAAREAYGRHLSVHVRDGGAWSLDPDEHRHRAD